MANLKQQALDKMLKEMEQEHSPSEDRIHNWLCEQEDDELFQGVLKEGYTIKAALKYVSNKAREFAQNGMACILDETVFEWVREYFLSNSKLENIRQVPVEPVSKKKTKPAKSATAKVRQGIWPDEDTKPDKPKKSTKGVVENQMSIFDFLDEA
ncbi:Cas9 inhibitor AcrIIA9 family protein [Streptococcus suis]|uniref:Cas9 inhibitor AcrIIA9 family protein n=1 Tax=Streptococcus suis TaxID=1307 RepID=UPI00042898BE|nr:Cas9 inhibitor AcrIIA9 family protein [Streptococcus suis]